MRTKNRTVEQKLARIASDAWGVVTRAELLVLGVSSTGIKRRVQKGLLLPEYPGVYRVGHRAPCVEARYLAAVKACGPGAVLGGRAAAYLQGLLRNCDPPPPEVTTPAERRIEGIETKRCRKLGRREVATLKGIPITTVPRTLVDLAAVLSEGELARACHEAGVRYGTTPRQVNAVLARRSRVAGAAKLRRIMGGETRVTLSTLERAFLKLLREEGLPLPVTNRRAGTKRVDCRWPEHNLTVELDSYRFHNTRHAWENDLRREREAHGREDRFRRYSHGDVLEDPTFMLRELGRLLRG